MSESPLTPNGRILGGLEVLSDAELVRAWQKSGGETGDPTAEAIAEEMQRRGIDF